METLPDVTLQATFTQRMIARAHHFLFTFRAMLNYESIVHHLAALLLCGGALLILQHPGLLPAILTAWRDLGKMAKPVLNVNVR